MSEDEPTPPIPFHRVDVSPAARAAVDAVLRSGWLTAGPVTRAFESEFGDRVGASHAVAVSSGTAALELALRTLDLRSGDAVITTPFSFTATAEVIVRCGAAPVFADVDRVTLNMSAATVESALREATSAGFRVVALLPVHFAGVPCAMDELDELARVHDLAIIEDAAHAFPSIFAGRPVGAPRRGGRSRAVCFSFYANKPLSTGEGGMLVTDDANVAQRVRRLSLHGIDRDAWSRHDESTDGPASPRSWDYEVTEIGTKSNFNDVAAALGRVGLSLADRDQAARVRIAQRYHQAFAGLSGVELPAWDDRSSHHLFVVRTDQRDNVVAQLSDLGVATSVHYRPLSLHRAYHQWTPRPGSIPQAMTAWPRVLSLPIYPCMSLREQDRVIDAFVTACRTQGQ